MVPHAHVTELFHRAMAPSNVAVVEGVMGLYDGRSSGNEEGSGAELAKLLGLPVLLVLDASSMARSAAAVALGFQRFDPALRFAGVFLNRVAGPGHARLCQEAIEAATGLPVLGSLHRNDAITLPERHLGLVPEVEGQTAGEVFERITSEVAAGLDVDRLLALSAIIPPAPSALPYRSSPSEGVSGLFPEKRPPVRARIAIAMDRSFSFYYQDSLDLLRAWGAELVPFSVMADSGLPEGTTGIYVGGGFPEVYALELAENRAMAAAFREAARKGIPMYAECGGLMYLGEALTDMSGVTHPMAGLLPLRSRLRDSRLTLGYRNARALADGPLLSKGQQVRGHEFHWSTLESGPQPDCAAYELERSPSRWEGWQQGSLFASYVHLHLAADVRLAPRFVQQCTFRERTRQWER